MGTYQPLNKTNVYNCIDCPAGYQANEVKADECTVCAMGRISGKGVASCANCPGGRFNDDDTKDASLHDTNDDCQTCPTGWWGASSIECSVCDNGKVGIDAATGTDKDRDSIDDCISCKPGQVSSDPTQICTDCEPGFYSNSAASVICSECVAGTYNPNVGSNVPCMNCNQGRFQTLTGSVACINCDAGKYNGMIGSLEDVCLDCEPGTSTNGMIAAALCLDCDPGTHSNSPGQLFCDTCQAGTWSDTVALANDCDSCQVSSCYLIVFETDLLLRIFL